MPKLFILCGLPYSGKSLFSKKIEKQHHPEVHTSKIIDEIIILIKDKVINLIKNI